MIEAAVLVASLALQGVAGVVTAPDIVPPATVSTVVTGPLAYDPDGVDRSVDRSWQRALHTRVDRSLLPQLAGRALLDQLALLSRADLRSHLADHPGSIRQLLLDPPAAEQTERWWRALPLSVRRDFEFAAPELLGNLPGIPYSIRDAANRDFLAETIRNLSDRVDDGVGRGEGTEIRARLSMLHQVELAIRPVPGEPTRTIVSLDTASPGRAAIVIGNIRTADYVSYLVPGMFFTVEGQVVDWAETAVDLYREQEGWLDRLGQTDGRLRDKTVATVAWMGYQTPSLFTVGSEDLADDGALYLDSAIDALYNERASDRPYVSLLAHSYGSTAAMKALATGKFEVDSFAVVGSPGSAAQSVDDLHVRGGNVFVGEASWDPVVGSGYFGSNPGAPSYGAKRMSVAGGTDLITDAQLTASVGHNEYFAPGSESLRNMALISIDRGSLVSDGSGYDVQRTLAYFDRLI